MLRMNGAHKIVLAHQVSAARRFISSAILRIGCILWPMRNGFAALILTVLVVGCGKPASSDGGKTDQAAAKPAFDPCESVRQLDPHCGWNPHWDDSGVSTNAIDGTKNEFLSLESTDADGTALL
jgi:hypothetical protein